MDITSGVLHSGLRGASHLHTRDELCNAFLDTREKGYDACSTSSDKQNLCEVAPGFCDGGLSMRRCDLPQVPAQEDDPEAFAEWVDLARTWNVDIEEETMPNVSVFLDFKPSQADLNLCKVCTISWDMDRCFSDGPPSDKQCNQRGSPGCLCAWKKGVSVADSGYIIDGHHHWAAIRLRLLSGLPFSGYAKFLRYRSSKEGGKEVRPEEVASISRIRPDLIGHSGCSAAFDMIDRVSVAGMSPRSFLRGAFPAGDST